METLLLDFATANTALGRDALQTNSTGGNNTGLGYKALQLNTTASNNTAVGYSALLANTTGANNTAVGYLALTANTGGGGNQAFGTNALDSCTIGDNNNAYGRNAGANVTTGSNNVFVGYNSGTDLNGNISTQSNFIVMGNQSHSTAYVKVAWTVTSDNRDKYDLGNLSTTDYGLSFVNQLEPKKFKYKDNREQTTEPTTDARFGFYAQDILALEGDNPVLIDDRDAESLKFKEASLVPVLVNAIKELSAKVDELQNEVNTLKGA
jgi:hypothetical protein